MQQLKIISIGLLMACSITHAQESDQKIVVEITKEIDGEKKTFKGEYNTPEEMRADPNYREFAGDEEDYSFWFDTGDDDLVIHLDQMKDMHKNVFRFFDDEDDPNGFFFHLDDDSSRVFDFKIADFDAEEFREKMEDLGIEMSEHFRHFKLDDNYDRVSIVDVKKIRVTNVEDEFGKRGIVEKNERLELEDLSFNPNPSSGGKLRIRFNTREEGDLSIKVSNLEGTDVFNRYFESFSGRYAETVDLSGQKEGIYLLEIIQGKKKITRKIIIN